MVTEQEAKKVRRIFTPEQKLEILKGIERCKAIKEGSTKLPCPTRLGTGISEIKMAMGRGEPVERCAKTGPMHDEA